MKKRPIFEGLQGTNEQCVDMEIEQYFLCENAKSTLN